MPNIFTIVSVMRIIFLFSLLSVTLICVTDSTHKMYNIPTCLMPCRVSISCPRPSLIKIFSTSVDSYTITTVLDGCEGNFNVSVSHNATDYHIFSAIIYVKTWYFNIFCHILSETPVITPFVNDTSRLSVHFPYFRQIIVHLQSHDEFITSMLFERVGSLQNELSTIKEQLNTLREDFEERIEIQPKLKYAIYNAVITGNTLTCQNPNPMKWPTADRYCYVESGNWLWFDLRQILKINLIQFRLWDQDARIYTYNLSVSPDRFNWFSLASRRTGTSHQEFKLDEKMEVRYIKMEGASTVNRNLVLCSFTVDCI